jgi:aquaporin Z
MFERARTHWPEYLMEALGLGLFMISAAGFTSLLEHPQSPIRHAVGNPFVRRLLMGFAMGLTAIALIYSPIGARSGAHINPATTLTFLRLRRIHSVDAAGYVSAQFMGGLCGILVAGVLFAPWIESPSVNYVVTLPGRWGEAAAFGAETLITFVLMTVILQVSNHPRFARYTGLCAGVLVATYITLEAPISGMSMNPARSFGPALLAGEWRSFWIYLFAPPLGMLIAAETYVRTHGLHRVFCAKLYHQTSARCIFNCRFAELSPGEGPAATGIRSPRCPHRPITT